MAVVTAKDIDYGTKYVLLDIDGCLTNTRDGSSFLCLDEKSYRISPKNLSLLMKFLEKTDSKVILTSNWRKFPDDGCWCPSTYSFKNQLPALREALGDRYVGELPYYHGMNKSDTFVKWCMTQKIRPLEINFVVIEDDRNEGFDREWFTMMRTVYCDRHVGFSEKQYKEALDKMDKWAKTQYKYVRRHKYVRHNKSV